MKAAIDIIFVIICIILQLVVFVILLLLCALYLEMMFVIKLLIVTACTLLYLGTNGVFTRYLLSKLVDYSPVSYQTIKNNNALILMGVGIDKVGRNAQPGLLGYSKIFETARIYQLAKQENIQYKIIISGGDPCRTGFTEAQVYAKSLKALGVTDNDIILEDESVNTFQNAEYTASITQKLPYKNYLLVGNAIHIKRAMLYFKHFGIKPIAAVADNPCAVISVIPNTYNLALLNLAMREYLGIWLYYFYNVMGLNASKINYSRKSK